MSRFGASCVKLYKRPPKWSNADKTVSPLGDRKRRMGCSSAVGASFLASCATPPSEAQQTVSPSKLDTTRVVRTLERQIQSAEGRLPHGCGSGHT